MTPPDPRITPALASDLITAVAQIDKEHPEPYRHGRHSWCQPGDRPHRAWMLIFSDQDMRTMVWTDENAERDAREAWDKYAPAWNCTLFCAAYQEHPEPTNAEVEAADRARDPEWWKSYDFQRTQGYSVERLKWAVDFCGVTDAARTQRLTDMRRALAVRDGRS